MAAVTLKGLRKRFGTAEVVKGVDLDFADGEFAVIVGPSGCGKSTLLRMIAGLEEISEGELRIGGRDVTDVDPKDRGVAMVFQNYALYPHMTVRENLSFALEMARRPKAEIEARVQTTAAALHIGELLDRRPAQLSGGQRQRVAVGRAIVREVRVFLFDEPLSNLDAALRVAMRAELVKLHRELRSTIVYVTHDQVEAMTLGDRIVVLEAGVVKQVGSPLELYHRPTNLFVAGFIGSPRMNFIKVEVAAVGDEGVTVKSADLPPTLIPVHPGKLSAAIRGHARRPAGERDPARAAGSVRIEGVVELVERLGRETGVRVTTKGGARAGRDRRRRDVRRGAVEARPRLRSGSLPSVRRRGTGARAASRPRDRGRLPPPRHSGLSKRDDRVARRLIASEPVGVDGGELRVWLVTAADGARFPRGLAHRPAPAYGHAGEQRRALGAEFASLGNEDGPAHDVGDRLAPKVAARAPADQTDLAYRPADRLVAVANGVSDTLVDRAQEVLSSCATRAGRKIELARPARRSAL